MAPAKRVGYLDGIRALAILSVLAVHWIAPYFGIGGGGYVGVDAFFVLSGYIITTILWKRRDAGGPQRAWAQFVNRRVKRLYPALIGLAVGATLLYAVLPGSAPWTTVARQAVLALTQTSSLWLAGGGEDLGPFNPTWSLSVEWYFYLLWPIFVLVVARRRWSAARTAHVTALTAAVLYGMALFQPGKWFYFGPIARFAELLAGGALALWFISRPTALTVRPKAAAVVSATAVASLGIYVLLGPGYLHVLARLVGVPLAAACTLMLIVMGATATRGPVMRLLEARPITLIGRTSYSFYLWHLTPMTLMGSDFLGLPRIVLALCGVGFAVTATAISFMLLERPFMRTRSDALAATRTRVGAEI